MKDLLLHPVSVVIVHAVACCGLMAISLMAISARAEQPVLLPRPIRPAAAATQPAQVVSVETIQRIYLSDGTMQEKSLGVVTLGVEGTKGTDNSHDW